MPYVYSEIKIGPLREKQKNKKSSLKNKSPELTIQILPRLNFSAFSYLLENSEGVE